MKAKKLFGKEVIDVDAKVVGKIVDIELDVSNASIPSILVKSGLTKKLSILPEDIDPAYFKTDESSNDTE